MDKFLLVLCAFISAAFEHVPYYDSNGKESVYSTYSNSTYTKNFDNISKSSFIYSTETNNLNNSYGTITEINSITNHNTLYATELDNRNIIDLITNELKLILNSNNNNYDPDALTMQKLHTVLNNNVDNQNNLNYNDNNHIFYDMLSNLQKYYTDFFNETEDNYERNKSNLHNILDYQNSNSYDKVELQNKLNDIKFQFHDSIIRTKDKPKSNVHMALQYTNLEKQKIFKKYNSKQYNKYLPNHKKKYYKPKKKANYIPFPGYNAYIKHINDLLYNMNSTYDLHRIDNNDSTYNYYDYYSQTSTIKPNFGTDTTADYAGTENKNIKEYTTGLYRNRPMITELVNKAQLEYYTSDGIRNTTVISDSSEKNKTNLGYGNISSSNDENTIYTRNQPEVNVSNIVKYTCNDFYFQNSTLINYTCQEIIFTDQKQNMDNRFKPSNFSALSSYPESKYTTAASSNIGNYKNSYSSTYSQMSSQPFNTNYDIMNFNHDLLKLIADSAKFYERLDYKTYLSNSLLNNPEVQIIFGDYILDADKNYNSNDTITDNPKNFNLHLYNQSLISNQVYTKRDSDKAIENYKSLLNKGNMAKEFKNETNHEHLSYDHTDEYVVDFIFNNSNYDSSINNSLILNTLDSKITNDFDMLVNKINMTDRLDNNNNEVREIKSDKFNSSSNIIDINVTDEIISCNRCTRKLVELSESRLKTFMQLLENYYNFTNKPNLNTLKASLNVIIKTKDKVKNIITIIQSVYNYTINIMLKLHDSLLDKAAIIVYRIHTLVGCISCGKTKQNALIYYYSITSDTKKFIEYFKIYLLCVKNLDNYIEERNELILFNSNIKYNCKANRFKLPINPVQNEFMSLLLNDYLFYCLFLVKLLSLNIDVIHRPFEWSHSNVYLDFCNIVGINSITVTNNMLMRKRRVLSIYDINTTPAYAHAMNHGYNDYVDMMGRNFNNRLRTSIYNCSNDQLSNYTYLDKIVQKNNNSRKLEQMSNATIFEKTNNITTVIHTVTTVALGNDHTDSIHTQDSDNFLVYINNSDVRSEQNNYYSINDYYNMVQNQETHKYHLHTLHENHDCYQTNTDQVLYCPPRTTLIQKKNIWMCMSIIHTEPELDPTSCINGYYYSKQLNYCIKPTTYTPPKYCPIEPQKLAYKRSGFSIGLSHQTRFTNINHTTCLIDTALHTFLTCPEGYYMEFFIKDSEPRCVKEYTYEPHYDCSNLAGFELYVESNVTYCKYEWFENNWTAMPKSLTNRELKYAKNLIKNNKVTINDIELAYNSSEEQLTERYIETMRHTAKRLTQILFE